MGVQLSSNHWRASISFFSCMFNVSALFTDWSSLMKSKFRHKTGVASKYEDVLAIVHVVGRSHMTAVRHVSKIMSVTATSGSILTDRTSAL